METTQYMQYIGCLALLARSAVHLRSGPDGDDIRDSIERALDDAIQSGVPIRWWRTLDRIDIEVVERKESA